MDTTNQKQQVQLAPGELRLFEEVSLRYDALIPKDVQPTDLLNPEFWAHHGVKLQPMNEIRARCEDGTWIANLVVLDCSRTWAKVALLSLYKLSSQDVALSQASENDVRAFIGRHIVGYTAGEKWRVTRRSDGAVLQANMQQKDAAIAWLEAHARAQVSGPAVAQPEAATA